MQMPLLGDAVPQRGNALTRGFGKAILRLMGWRFVGTFPNRSHFVVIAAPHTSNWDFVVGMSALLASGIRAHWLGKHTLFRWPFGYFMRWLGGIPVNRAATEGLVEQSVAAFQAKEQLVLGIAPEGTRKKVDRWKTGFYRIAHAADVPIVFGFFDFVKKEVGVGGSLHPSGDLEADLATILAFYATTTGKRPEQF